MKRHPDFWRLPGPRRFARSLVDGASRRRSAAVQEPVDPESLAVEVEALIHADGLDRCLRIDLDGRDTFLKLLRDRASTRSATAQGISSELQNTVILLTGRVNAADAADLDDFVRSANHRDDPAASSVLAISVDAGPLCSAPHWQTIRTLGCVGPLDVTAFAAELVTSSADILVRVATAVAVEVGAWDIDIVERIFDAGPAIAIRPDLQVQRWADVRLDAWRSCEGARWEQGQFDLWNGEIAAHPLFLVTHSPERLVRRVWRGQLAILLPWIEERRRELVQASRRTLMSAGLMGDTLDTLDWGPLCAHLSNGPASVAALANTLRLLRNELAHGRPVSFEAARLADRAARRWHDALADPPSEQGRLPVSPRIR